MADACDDELPVRVGENPLVAVDDCINLGEQYSILRMGGYGREVSISDFIVG